MQVGQKGKTLNARSKSSDFTSVDSPQIYSRERVWWTQNLRIGARGSQSYSATTAEVTKKATS